MHVALPSMHAVTLDYVACERAAVRNPDGISLRPTLLGAVFHRGDVEIAAELAGRIAEDGYPERPLATTLDDRATIAGRQLDPDIRAGLRAILGKPTELIPRPASPPVRYGQPRNCPG